ncbi:hypothetical protein MY4824_003019 [Beauveria thailandica]
MHPEGSPALQAILNHLKPDTALGVLHGKSAAPRHIDFALDSGDEEVAWPGVAACNTTEND